jgi:hypothetical protein
LACSTVPSSSELRPAPTANVDLATPNREPVALSLDDKGVRFGGQLLVRLSEDRAKGAEESHKRRGPDDLLLVPVEAWIKDRRNEGRLDATLTLILQRETPYRGLMEVLFTAGQNEISAFDLYESSAAGRSLHLDLTPRAYRLALHPEPHFADRPRRRQHQDLERQPGTGLSRDRQGDRCPPSRR